MKMLLKCLKVKKVIVTVAVTLMAVLFSLSYYFSASHPHSKQTIHYAFTSDQKAVFEPVLPGVPVVFPKDFSFHDEYQNEEWGYFANLLGNDGQQYSVQWSYYRIARDEGQSSGWNSSQLYLSQVVVTSEKNVWKEQRIARGGIGQAGLIELPFRLWIDNWSWRSISLSPLPGILNIETDEFSVRLNSSSYKSFLPLGVKGYISEHDLLPLASYGFDAPFVRASGRLILNGEPILVSGQASLYKQWGSDLDSIEGQKKVVLNLHLSDGRHLTLNQNRVPNHPIYTYGSITRRDGSRLKLEDTDVVMTAIEYSPIGDGKNIPTKWVVKIDKIKLELTTSPIHDNMWHRFYNPYWQGPVNAIGTQSAQGSLQVIGF